MAFIYTLTWQGFQLRFKNSSWSYARNKKRILYGCAEIRNFSSSIKKYFTSEGSKLLNTNVLLNHLRKAWKGAIFICNHSNSDLFTCENNMLFSRVKYRVFARKLTWFIIGVYIKSKNFNRGAHGLPWVPEGFFFPLA